MKLYAIIIYPLYIRSTGVFIPFINACRHASVGTCLVGVPAHKMPRSGDDPAPWQTVYQRRSNYREIDERRRDTRTDQRTRRISSATYPLRLSPLSTVHHPLPPLPLLICRRRERRKTQRLVIVFLLFVVFDGLLVRALGCQLSCWRFDVPLFL